MLPNEIRCQRVLLSPLNWGMGHVARCIPLIDQLICNENKVFVACDPIQQDVLLQYFTDVVYIDHPGYPFKFHGNGRFGMDLLRQFGRLRSRLIQEREEVSELVTDHGIDVIISDHRYGFHNSKCHSIFLTHQINLPHLWHEGIVQYLHQYLMGKFDEIWVPDVHGSELSGKLSLNTSQFTTSYIGWLSRFSLYPAMTDKTVEKVIVISGPHVYAKQLLAELLATESKCPVIAAPEIFQSVNIQADRMVSSADWRACDQLLNRTKKIISRSGYSTLMDLKCLGISGDLYPTPGQREQVYLKYLWDENIRRFHSA